MSAIEDKVGRWDTRCRRLSSFPIPTGPAACWPARSCSSRVTAAICRRCRASSTPASSARTSPSRRATRPPARRAVDPRQPQGRAWRSRSRQAAGAAVRHGQRRAGFDRMPQVIDGASDFFYELLGPKAGQHARSAVGLAELPHGIRRTTPILYSFDQSVGWVERAAKPNARSRTPMVSLRAQPILRELPIKLDNRGRRAAVPQSQATR